MEDLECNLQITDGVYSLLITGGVYNLQITVGVCNLLIMDGTIMVGDNDDIRQSVHINY
jgi:hypothetical protein